MNEPDLPNLQLAAAERERELAWDLEANKPSVEELLLVCERAARFIESYIQVYGSTGTTVHQLINDLRAAAARAREKEGFVMSEDMTALHLPNVAGDRVERSLAALDIAARHYIAREQARLDSDTGLIAVLCDTVRLIREHVALLREDLTQ